MPTQTATASSENTRVCSHWGTCGGCSLLTGTPEGLRAYPYADELAIKEKKVREQLANFDVDQWRPILGSPELWYYRNKMEYAFGSPSPKRTDVPLDRALLGLRHAGRFNDIIDIDMCLLLSPAAEELLKIARAWAMENNFSGYNRKLFKGDLRYLVIRESKNTGERMAILIASSHLKPKLMTTPALESLTEKIKPLLSTCYLAFTDKSGDVARTDDMHLLWGPGSITEILNGIRYRISPFSFFQTNTRGTERLHGLLLDWAKGIGEGALIDLYCGSGAIGLSLAKGFDRIIGIDTNAEAIRDAQFNAAENGIGQAEFVAEDAMEFLKKLPGSKLSVQISGLVVDPPRPGLHPKALSCLLEINPPRLAYVSCNPESLARDLGHLAPLYRIASVQPVDLFPHTTHVETVALLEHR